MPQSLLNLLWRYWLKLFYLFEVLLIILGVVVSSSTVWRIGIVAFVATAAVNAIVLLLGDVVEGKGRWWRAVRLVFAGFVSLILVLGIILILAALDVWEFENWIELILGF